MHTHLSEKISQTPAATLPISGRIASGPYAVFRDVP
jgi:hypothetical protein